MIKPCLHFSQVTIVTLTFNLVNPKSKRVISSPRPIRMWNAIALRHIVLKKMNGNYFYKTNPWDLDLWSSQPKIHTGHVLTKTNQHVIWIILKILSKKHILFFKSDPCDLDLWPLVNPKSIRSLSSPRQIRM